MFEDLEDLNAKNRIYYRRMFCRYDVRGQGFFRQKAEVITVPTTVLNAEDYCIKEIQRQLEPQQFIEFCKINNTPIIKAVVVDRIFIR